MMPSQGYKGTGENGHLFSGSWRALAIFQGAGEQALNLWKLGSGLLGRQIPLYQYYHPIPFFPKPASDEQAHLPLIPFQVHFKLQANNYFKNIYAACLNILRELGKAVLLLGI